MNKILEEVEKIIIESDDENPTVIATITPDEVNVAKGYRVRLTPNYN